MCRRLSSTMGSGECIDASGLLRFIRASALLCIASSRLAAGRSQLIVRLAVASHPYRGGCSRARDGQAQMHGWSSDFGLRSKAGRRGPVAQWQQPSKRRAVSRLLIGRAKCRCAPQPGQSAARSRLAAGIQSLNPGPLSCAAGIRGAPPKLPPSSTSYLLVLAVSMNASNSVHSSRGAHNCGIQQSNACRHIAMSSNHKPPALTHPCLSCLYRSCICLSTCIR